MQYISILLITFFNNKWFKAHYHKRDIDDSFLFLSFFAKILKKPRVTRSRSTRISSWIIMSLWFINNRIVEISRFHLFMNYNEPYYDL